MPFVLVLNHSKFISVLLFQVKQHGIPHRQLGKLIVCQTEDQRAKIESLYAQAAENGVSDCRLLTARECAEVEPAVRAHAGMYSPSTGIVDSHSLMESLAGELQQVQLPRTCWARLFTLLMVCCAVSGIQQYTEFEPKVALGKQTDKRALVSLRMSQTVRPPAP